MGWGMGLYWGQRGKIKVCRTVPDPSLPPTQTPPQKNSQNRATRTRSPSCSLTAPTPTWPHHPSPPPPTNSPSPSSSHEHNKHNKHNKPQTSRSSACSAPPPPLVPVVGGMVVVEEGAPVPYPPGRWGRAPVLLRTAAMRTPPPPQQQQRLGWGWERWGRWGSPLPGRPRSSLYHRWRGWG